MVMRIVVEMYQSALTTTSTYLSSCQLSFFFLSSPSCHFIFCVKQSIWVADLRLWGKDPHYLVSLLWTLYSYNQVHIWEITLFLKLYDSTNPSHGSQRKIIYYGPLLYVQIQIKWPSNQSYGDCSLLQLHFHTEEEKCRDFLWCWGLLHIISILKQGKH